MRGWEDLPITIFERLPLDSKDFAHCTAVCRTWRHTIERSDVLSRIISRHVVIVEEDLIVSRELCVAREIGKLLRKMTELFHQERLIHDSVYWLIWYMTNINLYKTKIFNRRNFPIHQFFWIFFFAPYYTEPAILFDIENCDIVLIFQIEESLKFKEGVCVSFEELFKGRITWKVIVCTPVYCSGRYWSLDIKYSRLLVFRIKNSLKLIDYGNADLYNAALIRKYQTLEEQTFDKLLNL